MQRTTLMMVPVITLALSGAAAGELASQSVDSKMLYPKMVALEQYLMPRDSEIAMARSAAPPSISGDAEIMVLGRQGFETVAKGKNGFTCMVERSWAAGFDDPDFWDPRLRSPVCFNPPAARFRIPLNVKRTQLALAGRSRVQIRDAVQGAVERNELAALEPGGMAYMLSKNQFTNVSVGHWLPHLMFFAPLSEGASWGAGERGSPVVAAFVDAPERFSLFLVPVGKWSDGTDSPAHQH